MSSYKAQATVLMLIRALTRHNSWCGETHIQKCFYFLQEGLSAPGSFEFVLYKHGPFSFDLHSTLSEMKSDGLIGYEPRAPFGGSYSVLPNAESLINAFKSRLKDWEPKVEYVASKVAPKGVGVATLERLGTALYAYNEDSGKTNDEIAARVHELKPHIPLEVALEAVHKTKVLISEFEGQSLSDA